MQNIGKMKEIFFLLYKGIVYGNDIGISVEKIFPEYKKENEIKTNIYIEGRHGEIKLNFKKCMEGYYELKDDKNWCTNIQPKEYYFDEKEKVYKKCTFPCLECFASMDFNSSNMNCKTCQNNYYLAEDTNFCYNNIPDNYYLDNDQILKRCHWKCKKCITSPINETNMNCLSCINDYYLIISTNNCLNKAEKDIYDKEEKEEKEEKDNNEKSDDNYKEIALKLSQKNNPYFYVFLTIIFLAIIISPIIIYTKCRRVINKCNICKKKSKIKMQ